MVADEVDPAVLVASYRHFTPVINNVVHDLKGAAASAGVSPEAVSNQVVIERRVAVICSVKAVRIISTRGKSASLCSGVQVIWPEQRLTQDAILDRHVGIGVPCGDTLVDCPAD